MDTETRPEPETTAQAEPMPEQAGGRRRGWARARRVALWVVAVVAVLALLAAGTVVWTVRRSFPQYDGELRLPGLTAAVTVHRDAHGVPQIYADNLADLFRAQGYVHAQERFWEMDFRRHLTAGRLAELFGADQVPTDTYLRTLGWRRVAQAEFDLVSAEVRAHLSAYAEGVNAWIAATGDGTPGGAVSLEYAVLGLSNGDYRIEPWAPADSLAWLKAMAWDLRGNMSEEIGRATLLAAGLSRAQVEELYPPYPYERNRPILDSGAVTDGAFVPTGRTAPPAAARTYAAAAPALMELRRGLGRLPTALGANGAHLGSNSWVVAGSRTTTGKPILANDPHLGPSMPGIWFQVGLHCACGFEVAGFGFSGVPGVIIGHNARIAWGFTNLGPDVTDLYLERVDGDRYQMGDRWLDLDRRQETINVAGGDPVTVTVRTSRHGPLLSDASAELRDVAGQPAYAVALRWTALEPGRTAEAIYTLNTAGSWADFRRAASLFEVPAQNMVYADVDGAIGYQSPGKIPVRAKGDGKWPAPGWDPAYEWRGYVPFGELPSAANPAQGYLVTANQAVVGPDYPRFLTDDWTYGYRSQRINDMLSAAGRVSVDDVQRMQFDSRNGMAPVLVPHLLRARLDGTAAQAQALLRDWDFQQLADAPAGTAQARGCAAAAYYNGVWRHLLLRLFDELPDEALPDGGDRWYEVVRPLLDRPSAPWWDVRSTPAVETAPEIVEAAMRDAAAELTDLLGDDPDAWRWGRLHRLTVRNQTFGESGIAPIEWLFNHGPADIAGGDAIVNATGWTVPEGYEVDWVPSMRMVVDLADLDASRWIHLTGQSGHAFHDHYADQFELWRTGQTLPMRWRRETVEREAAHTLTLRP